jgi:hypothetical protein
VTPLPHAPPAPACSPSQLNVQRNHGLPLFIYRYMRRYRGW